MTIEAGTRIGKYEIQSLLGAGGMGEVYRAQDTELNRPVALKFLPDDVALDPRRMKRLIHEARAASFLNHPNILTVYEIGQTDGGARFFVTEFVNGMTLREHMQTHRLKLGDVLDLGAQVASALVAAHAEGIVHRDIKPENVMIRPDRVVKVLDFGLAKVTGQPGVPVNAEATTQTRGVVGTVAYMSPEQARGEAVDARTDVWSLGVVLYEMLAGRQPFRGSSAGHTLVSIQEDEPTPLAQHVSGMPELLQEIVGDAMAKDRDARLTAKQALAKLERLKRRLDAGLGLDHAVTPDAPEHPPASQAGAAAGAGAQAATPEPGSLHATAQSGRRRMIAAALALGALGGVAFLYFLMWPRAPRSQAPALKLTKMNTSQVSAAVISPDGKYFACVTSKGGKQSLLLRNVAEPSNQGFEIKLPAGVNPTGISYSGIAFSPDRDYLYYIISENNNGYGALYRKSLKLSEAGYEPQKIVSDASGAVTVSPNGKKVAFKRHLSKTRGVVLSSPNDGMVLSPSNEETHGKQPPASDADYDEDQLLTWDEDRAKGREDHGGERVLVTRREPDSIGSLAWSPDGQVIAYVSGGEDGNRNYENIKAVNISDEEAVNVSDEKARTISSARWGGIGSLVWLSDGSGLIITGKANDAPADEPAQVWHVPYPGGPPSKLTTDTGNYVSLTGNSNVLLAVLDNRFSEISIVDGGDTRRLLESSAYIISFAWVPKDGRIVYSVESGKESGDYDIWTINVNGSDQKPLLPTPDSDIAGAVLPDGSIIYRSYHKKEKPDDPNDTEKISLRRMDAKSRNWVSLVGDLKSASAMQVSPDSQWVYYTAPGESGKPTLWKVSTDGGGPTTVRDGVEGSRLSPDGKQFVAFEATANPRNPGSRRKIIIFPADGGEPVWKHDAPSDIGDTSGLDWWHDGQAINYVAPYEGVPNVWRLPLHGEPQHLTNWNDGDISWLACSRDGRKLGVVRHTATTDLVLIKIEDSR
jgi:Tol biopolymer transport system component